MSLGVNQSKIVINKLRIKIDLILIYLKRVLILFLAINLR